MRLALANPRDAFAAASVGSGGIDFDRGAAAEQLRAELHALGNATRTMLVRRVQQLLAPLTALEPKALLELCSDLERAGDVNEAPGGVLFATPLRAIPLGPTAFRVVGSMPTVSLQSKLPGDWTSDGVIRHCRIDVGTDDHWRAGLVSGGGVIVSPEIWAGFDTVPKADAHWLVSLDARLALPSTARPGGRPRHDAPLLWKALLQSGEGMRWMTCDSNSKARLWRAWNEYGYWVFAWTDGGHPSLSACMPLTNDEAARALFALARTLGSPVVVGLQPQGDASEVRVPHWLPRAEYRYLSVSAQAWSRKGSETTWLVPDGQLGRVAAALSERLGISFRQLQTA